MIRKQNEKEVPPASLFFAKIVKKMTKKCYPQNTFQKDDTY